MTSRQEFFLGWAMVALGCLFIYGCIEFRFWYTKKDKAPVQTEQTENYSLMDVDAPLKQVVAATEYVVGQTTLVTDICRERSNDKDCKVLTKWTVYNHDAGPIWSPATRKDSLHIFEHWQPFSDEMYTLKELNSSKKEGVWWAYFMAKGYPEPISFIWENGVLEMSVPYMDFMDAREALTMDDVQSSKQEKILSSLIFTRRGDL